MATEYDAFQQGVSYGGLRNKGDIRLLLCYLLKSIGPSVSKQILNKAILETELANYFELNQAFLDLTESGNASVETVDGETLYTITPQGEYNAGLLVSHLPRSVKEKAVKAALSMLTIYRREKENDIKISKTDKGYKVDIDVFATANKKDGDKLLSLTLYTTDTMQAERVKTGFLADPARLCEVIMETLLNHEYSD